jgi:phage tail protein X
MPTKGPVAETGSKKSRDQKVIKQQAKASLATRDEVRAVSFEVSTSQLQNAPDLAEVQRLSTSGIAVSIPDITEQERAVEAVKAAVPSSARREELSKDPIYRIMHALPRSDVLEVVRSRFAAPHCARAAAYFDMSYMKNPLRHLRLQIGCDGPTGLYLFFSRIAAHRHTLRVLDLSRNRLCSDDVVLLCNLLGFGVGSSAAATSLALQTSAGVGASRRDDGEVGIGELNTTMPLDSPPSSSSPSSGPCLEVLDLSYNTKVGNDGAVHVLRALQRCPSIRALLLKSTSVDDAGALAVSDVTRRWPRPVSHCSADSSAFLSSSVLRPSTASATKFYLNLNENCIGARGTYLLGKGLPDYVSLTLAKQRPPMTRDRKRSRLESENIENTHFA